MNNEERRFVAYNIKTAAQRTYGNGQLPTFADMIKKYKINELSLDERDALVRDYVQVIRTNYSDGPLPCIKGTDHCVYSIVNDVCVTKDVGDLFDWYRGVDMNGLKAALCFCQHDPRFRDESKGLRPWDPMANV